MPELPEIETIRRCLVPKIINKKITNIIIYKDKLRFFIDKNIPKILKNKIIKSIKRRAKYLLIEFDCGFLIFHLGMSGTIKVVKLDTKLVKHDHFKIDFNSLSLRFNDPRRFGAIFWCERNTKHKKLNNIGIEPLTNKLNKKNLYLLTQSKNTTIKNFLMNAQYIAGIGNIYASEILFYSQIHPMTKTKNINQSMAKTLSIQIKNILKKAIEKGGSTIKDHRLIDGSVGYFSQYLAVYGKVGEKCYICNSIIKCIKQNSRMSYFCPKCQLLSE